MDSWKSRILGVAAMSVLALAASCDNGPSAVETRARGEAPAEFEQASTISTAPAEASPFAAPAADDALPAARPQDAERLMWSANRKYSARQNADYHFRRDGKDFGAPTVDAYVAKAHAFIRNPPPGTLTLRRRNGDRLFYHPASNTFAVATRAGAPRTMFKPRDGMAYWEKQKASLDRGQRTSRSRRKADDGEN